jgi:serine/threonine-protein kinase
VPTEESLTIQFQRGCPLCKRTYSAGVGFCPYDGACTEEQEPDPLVGQVLFDKYLVLSVLGIGGWACVYKARHTALNKLVALKVLHRHLSENREKVSRFMQEAQAASALQHPNIPRWRQLSSALCKRLPNSGIKRSRN